jgi:hypothetical protein
MQRNKGPRLERKKSSDKLYKFLQEVFIARDGYLIWNEDNPLPPSLGDMKKTVETVQLAYERAVFSMAELYWVYSDVIGCRRMARKYPWDPQYIRRSDYFRYISMLFLHLVYVFGERMKGAVLWCNMVPTLGTSKIDGSKVLREIRKQLTCSPTCPRS